MPRIVSLIASATEIVCELGFASDLVGRSHECDHPPSIRSLPVCTRPKIDVHASSAEIDRQIRAVVRDALSVYAVDEKTLRDLEPDVIVTQTQCEVCAVSLRDVERAVCSWLEKCPQLVSLCPDSLTDVFADVERVAVALHARDAGDDLIGRMKSRMSQISQRALAQPDRPRVACVEWIDPLMAAGNWVPELVELAGGVNLFGQKGAHAPRMTWEELREADPDVVVLMPCGFDLARTLADVPILAALPGWQQLKAVRAKRVFATDGNQYFNRPGPRLVESLEILAELLHPSTSDRRHEGSGWTIAS